MKGQKFHINYTLIELITITFKSSLLTDIKFTIRKSLTADEGVSLVKYWAGIHRELSVIVSKPTGSTPSRLQK